MIPGFEDFTPELNEIEIETATLIGKSLAKRDKFNKITSKGITEAIFKHNGFKLNGAKLRKMIHYLRANGLPIIADSKGYHVSYDEKELSQQITSLEKRCNAIRHAAFSMKIILKTQKLL